MRRTHRQKRKADHHARITDTVSIRARPASVGDWTVPGSWERDLLFGSYNS